MFGRYLRIGALFLCGVSMASAQGQDPPTLTRALERAERFDVGLGLSQQLTTKWLGGDRLAYATAGKAPWTIVEGSTGRVLKSEADDAAVGGPGPTASLPLGLASFVANSEPGNSGPWTTQSSNGALIVSDSAGASRLTLAGAQDYGWGMAPNAWNRDRTLFVAVRIDNRKIHRVPIVDYSSAVERVTSAPYPKTGTS
jgi:hypothetical protein